ncbi:MAG TPA: adenosylcobinamide-GDP ribazoletransferase [Alphaproteobacteria bacterium]|nr:adenosylcobinamide-GDP ribazoletransferase [Alphaproteobacteria bacterium]
MRNFRRLRIDWSSFDWRSLGRGWPADLRVAARFFTCLPLGGESETGHDAVASGLRAWPLVGLVVGLFGGFAYAVASRLGLAPIPSALLALLMTVCTTGAFHEDGLADFADGLGGRDLEHRLAIMRDGRIGAFGAIALLFSLGLRAGALAQIASPGAVCAALAAAAAASRGLAPILALTLMPARPDGLGVMLDALRQETVVAAVAVGTLAVLLILGLGAGLVALALGLAGVAAIGTLAQQRLGGYTGDVLGAAQQVAEIVILLAAAIFS